MRKLTVTAALLGLTALGVTVPTTAAQAADSAVAGCGDLWGPRNGKVYAWDLPNCQGTLIYVGTGNAADWGDASDKASSVMNRGYAGSLDHVAFYDHAGYGGGHGCLAPGELYVADLAYNRFNDGTSADNRISAHRWVNRSFCSTLWT
ncbi:peptidase inhibitor family I36 protein [Streptomyces sp. DSM 40750]|uniref:peptidase inhibitor family I36 protein n=1 Tax=Streptomyces sp. DSM 40750 TaxID=2801030 RepID=UPI00214A9730|nr:peptidase inhibitor family I36 protein [Streptomyces sp. DSM 40750]UUU26152.1 peptidase inhibitor family I36 protein [Streptomyces sp. DSM 40750]